MSRHAHDPPPYLAHSANDNGAGVAEPLAFHLRSVAERAAEFAAAFGAAEQARAPATTGQPAPSCWPPGMDTWD